MKRTVLLSLGCCLVLLLAAGLVELGRASSAADDPLSACGSGVEPTKLGAVTGTEWPNEWSWGHFGWRCVLRFDDGSSDIVYFR